jgi:(1->4)-alpha-D-glucan 1-alpha-D-glucosylmutase
MWVNSMLSCRILMFEKDWQVGSMVPSADCPGLALCASASHDLPTLRGFWKEADLELRESLRLYPDADMAPQQRDLRKRDKGELLSALARENLLDGEQLQAAAATDKLSEEPLIAVQVFLARAPSCLMILQLEDLLGQEQQVNLPGTIEQYANWRHKICVEAESRSTGESFVRIARAVDAERRRRRADPG